jgi:site-specific recombinase XerD
MSDHEAESQAKAELDHHISGVLENDLRAGGSSVARSFPFERYHSFVLRFLNRLKVTGKSPHTIAAYRNDLGLFGRFIKDQGVDPCLPGPAGLSTAEHWNQYLTTHGRASAASSRRAQMSVRTFLHFLVESQIIGGSPLLASKSPRQPQNPLFTIPEPQFQLLCRHIEGLCNRGDTKARRDLALVLVLGRAGLKASEAAAVLWVDLNLPQSGRNQGTLVVRSTEHPRLVPLDAATTKALKAYRAEALQRSEGAGAAASDASVFFGFQNMTRRLSPKAMQRHSVKFIIYELCRDFLGTPYNSESLRNHAILRWIAKGFDAQRVADLAGYSSLQSLERFLTPDSTLGTFRRRQKPNRGTRIHERNGNANQNNRKLRNP